MPGPIEIRCPIYGFIPLDEWEREIISQPAFQRLRRIKQLAWTDYVYPGAMHTRFEHSLGVMHMATLLYDNVVDRCWPLLSGKLSYDDAGKRRYKKLVRLAALLHDVGHGPFSHAAEDLAPLTPSGMRSYKHEEYSTAVIKGQLRDVIENHPANNNYGFRAEDISGLIEGGTQAGRSAIWQDVISGQLDADRMDYLLRDSHHAGVEYGKYDWRRIVATVKLVPDPESGTLRFGVHETGRHAAEALIIARYMMFNQVYFHKTRVILDFHFHETMTELLPGGKFPPPTPEGIVEYLKWDDWRVLGALSRQEGGEHGQRLLNRDFFREIWTTPEFPSEQDSLLLNSVEENLGSLVVARCAAGKSWYKLGDPDLPIAGQDGTKPLSQCSTIVGSMQPTNLTRLYVSPEHRVKAEEIVKTIRAKEN
jgi:HD superfamily phosphohydrolase